MKKIWIIITVLAVVGVAVFCGIKFGVVDKVKDKLDTTFRVEYNDEVYTGEENKLTLPQSGTATFTVKGVDSYTVKVLANVDSSTDFSYTVNGDTYWFSQVDLNKALNGSVSNGAYVIDCEQDLSVKGLLTRYHENAEVVVDEPSIYPYLLVFENGDEKITFALSGRTTVILSHDKLVF